MSKKLIGELRELHTNIGGAIEILDLLVEENSPKLIKEWATSLFKMAIDVELRASVLGSKLVRGNHANTEGAETEADDSTTQEGPGGS